MVKTEEIKTFQPYVRMTWTVTFHLQGHYLHGTRRHRIRWSHIHPPRGN